MRRMPDDNHIAPHGLTNPDKLYPNFIGLEGENDNN
jgi:hypothetical protein